MASAGARVYLAGRTISRSFPGKQGLICRSLSPLRPASTNSHVVEDDVKSLDSLPGPPRLPLFGSSWIFLVQGLLPGAKPLGKRLLDAQSELVEKYGKILRIQFPGMQMVPIADPADVEKVLRSDGKYPRRFDSPVLNFYRETRKKTPGVFFENGEEWYKHRSVISKRILRPKEMAQYVPELNAIVDDFVSRLLLIRHPSGTEKENEIPDLDQELFKWSFESVADIVFDRRFGCLEENMNPEAQEFISSIGTMLANIVSASLLPPALYKVYETQSYKTFADAFDKMYDYAELFINRRIEELRRKRERAATTGDASDEDDTATFFEFLLASDMLTEEDLLSSVIDLLFAGVDTTSNTIQWALYLLSKNPDKQEKLYREVLSVVGPSEPADVQALARMPFLKACIRETLRLYPVLSSVSRMLEEDIVLKGYNIPAVTQISFPFYYMSHSEDFFPDARSFKPERWLRDERDAFPGVKSAFASLPFGFGTRMCVGRRVAELEMNLLLSRLVQQFLITYPEGEVVEAIFRGVTIPDRAMRVRLEDRGAPRGARK